MARSKRHRLKKPCRLSRLPRRLDVQCGNLCLQFRPLPGSDALDGRLIALRELIDLVIRAGTSDRLPILIDFPRVVTPKENFLAA